MAFWSSQRLEANLANLINEPDPELVDCNAVTLKVGREIYITPSLEQPAPNSHTKQILDPGAPFTIPPGQFAFLLTEEVVTIPPELMGFISMKATYKLKGLVNVSGFHVDPGWSGPLIFSVFNAGPAAVHLHRGLPLFLLWVADLDQASAKRKTKPGPASIPPTMINNITGLVDSIYALEKRLRDQLKDLADKDTELSDRMHAIDKTQNRVLIWLGIAGVVLVAATGVAVNRAVMSFFDSPAVTRPVLAPPGVPGPTRGPGASAGQPDAERQR
jgi:dCTP deaminase